MSFHGIPIRLQTLLAVRMFLPPRQKRDVRISMLFDQVSDQLLYRCVAVRPDTFKTAAVQIYDQYRSMKTLMDLLLDLFPYTGCLDRIRQDHDCVEQIIIDEGIDIGLPGFPRCGILIFDIHRKHTDIISGSKHFFQKTVDKSLLIEFFRLSQKQCDPSPNCHNSKSPCFSQIL